ncbi:LAMI_0E11166g1_1 [Lachancea mirantina]|uniref:ATPase inhibitor, mitochondrial n=1 Tax=Lachancea mirantina TaxID=1230905 RepID=A0A1G4JPD8_9SACH|nr:LAMI_0E11166g1_1 [Lachancea mirantina]
MLARTSIRQAVRMPRAAGVGGAAVRFVSEGSTGTTRGEGADDSFVKRERAQEDYYVKQHEKEQLARLREQIKQQQKKIDHLEEKLENFSK